MKPTELLPEALLERSSKLPDEIIAAQTSRSDILKWKLLIVAGLGAAGFGLSKDDKQALWLLALIPFVCIYADLLCTNLKLRILVIGAFYVQFRRDEYERFAQRNREVFKTEDWALYWSTIGICFILYTVGGILGDFGAQGSDFGILRLSFKEADIVMWAAILGLALSIVTTYRAERLIKNKLGVREEQEPQTEAVATFLRSSYTGPVLAQLADFLTEKGVFLMQSLPNGLFSAAASANADDVSGYQNVWVRDNVHVAHAHYVCGDSVSAGRTLAALMRYFQSHIRRFHDVVSDQEGWILSDPMRRPHIRFNGRTMKELSQQWPHAQNDALGYFLWCYCKLARAGAVQPGENELRCLGQFPLFFEAVRYWQDRDSGHWEETRKVSASSIGAVVAGLREFAALLGTNTAWAGLIQTELHLDSQKLQELGRKGEESLARILPCESIEPERCYRRFDSALLFLIYPLEVLEGKEMAAVILEDVRTHLQGGHGIRRYLGDSYWFPDYKQVPEWKRTADFSGSMEERDAGIRLGQEAQWCIFDPIISVIYGRMHLKAMREGKPKEAGEFLRLQTAHFNRSLSQLTTGSEGMEAFRAPEAYYLENSHYVPNDHTPLLWTQANLWLALHQMRLSVEEKA